MTRTALTSSAVGMERQQGAECTKTQVTNGKIYGTLAGTYRELSPSESWQEWFHLQSSPYPESRERAQGFHEALTEIGYFK